MKVHLVPRLSRMAVVTALAFAGVVSFYAYQAVDDVAPRGYTRAITITSIPGSLKDSAVAKLLESTARLERVNLLRPVGTVDGRDGPRHLLAIVGDPERFAHEFPRGSYPSFGFAPETILDSSEDLGKHDLRGVYFTNGGRTVVERFGDALEGAGVAASLEVLDPSMVWQRVIDDLRLAPVGAAVSIFVVLAMASAGERLQKCRALGILHGTGEWRSLVRELLQFLVFGVAVSAAVVAIAAVLLSALGQTAQFASYATWLGAALFGSVLVCLIVHVAVFLLMPAPRPIQVIRGKRPLAFVASTAVVCQGLALLLILVTISSTLAASESAQAISATLGRWMPSSDLVGVRASLDLATEPPDELAEAFGRFYDDPRVSNESVLAYGVPGATFSDGFAPYSGNVILVNPNFLKREVVRRDDGQRVEAGSLDEAAVTLLIPAGMNSATPEIEKVYLEFATFQRELRGDADKLPPVRVVTIPTRPGQDIFNFADGTSGSMLQTDPVIAVFPHAGRYLSENFYLSSASTGNLLFSDARVVNEMISAYSLKRLVIGLSRPAELASSVKTSSDREVLHGLLTCILAGGCLLLTSCFLASAYAAIRRDAIFARRVHGWRFIRTHTAFFTAVGGAPFVILVALLGAGYVSPAASMPSAMLSLGCLATVIALLRRQPRSPSA